MNILYVESSRSWGGQEYRTCLEIYWLNAHGHQAWLVCNPGSQVHDKASELGTRLITMSIRSRVDPFPSSSTSLHPGRLCFGRHVGSAGPLDKICQKRPRGAGHRAEWRAFRPLIAPLTWLDES